MSELKNQICLWLVMAALAAGAVFFLFSSDTVENFYMTQKASKLHNNGRYEEAIAVYERLLELDPDNGNTHWNMAVAYLQNGDKESAREEVAILRKMHEHDLVTMLEDLIARNASVEN